jgi:hypothetical protein
VNLRSRTAFKTCVLRVSKKHHISNPYLIVILPNSSTSSSRLEEFSSRSLRRVVEASLSLPMAPATKTLHSAAGLAFEPRNGVPRKMMPLVHCNNFSCLTLALRSAYVRHVSSSFCGHAMPSNVLPVQQRYLRSMIQ